MPLHNTLFLAYYNLSIESYTNVSMVDLESDQSKQEGPRSNKVTFRNGVNV